MPTIIALVAMVVLALAATHERASAFTSNGNLNVATAVEVRCSVVTGDLSFGSAYVSGQVADLDTVSTVIVNCDPGRKVAIKMGQGLHPAAGSNDNNPLRRMQNGPYYLDYNIYDDASYTSVWDNRSNATKTTRVFPYTATVYGRIPGGQAVSPGTYSDTVVTTIHY